jgi:hypothetical protein
MYEGPLQAIDIERAQISPSIEAATKKLTTRTEVSIGNV